MSCPDSRSDPISESESSPGSKAKYRDSFFFFFFKTELVLVGIQTIFVITKIIYIHKRTTIEVVSIKIYTHILSLIYLYKYLYMYISNTNIRDRGKVLGAPISEIARTAGVECPVLFISSSVPTWIEHSCYALRLVRTYKQ